MSSTNNFTQYNVGCGASGTTSGGTTYGMNLAIQANAGADFTDETYWTLYDAVLTALQSAGWPITAADLSSSKMTYDDTQYTGDPTAKTFS